jgi:NADH-quinone oxidoreductase subunit L
VLGALSAFGGFLNVPTFFPIAPTDRFAQWLAPVTGAATLRITRGIAFEPEASTGFTLGVIAAGVALLGILIAVFRFKPERLLPKREATVAEALVPEPAIERVVAHNYYIDELYERAIVRPTIAFARNVLWLGVDGLIDGLVNLSAAVSRWVGAAGSALESGQVGTYAWALVLGVIAVLGIASVR